MTTAPDARASRRRRWLLPLLVGYVALLFLAAWPEPVRPGFADAPQLAAYRLLSLAGIRAGQPVFTIEDALEYGTVADCHYARGIEGSGAVVDVWPEGGRCKDGGFRFRLPPREIFHTRGLLQALSMREIPQVRDGILGAMARTFCWRGDDVAPFASVDVLWVRNARNYEDATLLRQLLLTFSWDCAEERVTRHRFFPDERAVLAIWGEEPWR